MNWLVSLLNPRLRRDLEQKEQKTNEVNFEMTAREIESFFVDDIF